MREKVEDWKKGNKKEKKYKSRMSEESTPLIRISDIKSFQA